jgi:CRISPR/Cas system type I-B associated protein Csh2 (Cas7 group RAMP superfamily)
MTIPLQTRVDRASLYIERKVYKGQNNASTNTINKTHSKQSEDNLTEQQTVPYRLIEYRGACICLKINFDSYL